MGCRPGNGNLGRLRERGAFEDSRHARVRPSFPNLAAVILAPGLARWATSGLFQLKPATPASTALAVLPMPAMSPCTHVLRYPGTLAVFVWLAVRRVGRVSHSCQFSGPAMGTNSIDLGVPVS